ncbi:uncharacterized protein LOC127542906 [Antechinus flavipes]|uniref:uncharacterized protein LOC127542906 n=1 Tax=Antechinus flavipes TaxID=38775 RepID=UPI0022356E8F|nr:uncharacterized protein LOC127542906 [Antechinus flavipes]
MSAGDQWRERRDWLEVDSPPRLSTDFRSHGWSAGAPLCQDSALLPDSSLRTPKVENGHLRGRPVNRLSTEDQGRELRDWLEEDCSITKVAWLPSRPLAPLRTKPLRLKVPGKALPRSREQRDWLEEDCSITKVSLTSLATDAQQRAAPLGRLSSDWLVPPCHRREWGTGHWSSVRQKKMASLSTCTNQSPGHLSPRLIPVLNSLKRPEAGAKPTCFIK